MLPVIVWFALLYCKPAGRFFTSTLLSSTPTPESDTFKFKVICFPVWTSVFPKPTVGFVLSPSWAVARFSALSTLSDVIAWATTWLPSLTVASFIVIAPEVSSILIPSWAPSVILHLFWAFLLAVSCVVGCSTNVSWSVSVKVAIVGDGV